MSTTSDDVRRYYDANTARFVRYGQGGASIHRAVWGPGVTTREAAMHWPDQLIVEELRSLGAASPQVLDLGCGVGASLLYIAERTDAQATGITLSGVQAERAREFVNAARLGDRIRCFEGNYLELPADVGPVDLAFSIEAFIHGPDPARYFREAARVVRPGGRLIVCDDFLARDPASAKDRQRLADFERGWRVGSLLPVARAGELAAAAGFSLRQDLDLTPHLELGRPRDALIGVAVALGRFLPVSGEYWAALRGGDALQRCLTSGILQYRFLVFERR